MNLPQSPQNRPTPLKPRFDPKSKEARTMRLSFWALICTFLTWFTFFLPLPWQFLGLIPTLGLIACIVLLPFAAWGTELQKRSLITAALYTIPAGFSIILLIFSGLFYGPLKSAQECQANALTHQAKSQCEQLIPGR